MWGDSLRGRSAGLKNQRVLVRYQFAPLLQLIVQKGEYHVAKGERENSEVFHGEGHEPIK